MAKPSTPVRTAFVDTISDFLARTLRAERRSENTIYSYCLSVRVLKQFLDVRGWPLAADVSRDEIRGFISEQSTPRTITDSQGRTDTAGSAATAHPFASSRSSSRAATRTNWLTTRCKG
jgi:site-specific recombinase XerD